ncbi:hypothetical protein GYMLUDRAFT_644441 [Collybiopsis luxurians FD-317 M1]|nr:hypothetical protein GYMLUDRAFT_644441 [Collybiopsis luxurians FD-317 M1]
MVNWLSRHRTSSLIRQVCATPLLAQKSSSFLKVSSLYIDNDQSFSKEREAAYALLRLPPDMTPHQAISALTKPDFLSSWKPGDKIIVPHRGDVGLHGGRYFPDLSMAAINRVFRTWGILSVEIDITPTKNKTFILAHERNANRMSGQSIDWADLEEEDITQMPLGFRPVGDNGVFSNLVYLTNQEVPSLKYFLDEAIRCVAGANAIVDARDHDDPAVVVADLSRMSDLRDSIAVQLYNLGYNNAAEFVKEVEKQKPHKDWKKNVMIIPVFRPEGMHKVANVDIDNSDFDTLAAAAFEWINSWTEASLRVPGYGFTVQGGFKLIDQKAHHVDKKLFRKQFNRNPTPADEANLVKDHVLAMMIAERKRSEPDKFIIVTSAAPTTNANGKLFRVRFRAHGQEAEQMDELDPTNNVKDWMYMEAAKAGSAFKNGGDVCITDQTTREISYHAFVQQGLQPPTELHDPMYPPFSQDSFLDTFVKQRGLA